MQALPGILSGTSRAAAAQPRAAASKDKGTDNQVSVTANEFLSLLVAEMKHQDPTSSSDPNQYINQLVQVNSLQQLIQINQTLSSAGASAAAAGGAGHTAPAKTGAGAASRVAGALDGNHARAGHHVGIRQGAGAVADAVADAVAGTTHGR